MAGLKRTRGRCPEGLISTLRSSGDESTRALRRALLHGNRILVVMAGYPGEPVRRDYFVRARELGVEVVILDSPKHLHLADDLIREGLVEAGLAVGLANDD